MAVQSIILSLDGRVAGPIRSAEGGYVRQLTVNGSVGGTRSRPASVAEIERLTMEVGAMPGTAVLQWIAGALDRSPGRRSLSIVSSTAGRSTIELDGYDAVIAEVALPTLDRHAASDAYMKLSVQCEPASRQQIASRRPVQAPPLTPLAGGAFRFSIDGVLPTGQETQRVEAITIKQGLKASYSGASRYAEIEPTKLEFPNLVITLPAGVAEPLANWQERARAAGARTAADEVKSGRLEYLSRGGAVALALDLSGLGIVSLSSNGGKVTAEFYCNKMTVDLRGA